MSLNTLIRPKANADKGDSAKGNIGKKGGEQPTSVSAARFQKQPPAQSIDQHRTPKLPVRYTLWGTIRKPKLKPKEIVQLTSQLAIMTRSGVDIVSAIESLNKQSRNPDAKQILGSIHNDVVSGVTFSEALRKHEYVFGASYVASITAGEASGKMWEVLDQLARLRRSQLKLRNSIKSLAAYPVALTAVSSIVIAALVLFVLPQFAIVFDNFDTPMPLITQLLINFSNLLLTTYLVWVPGLILTVTGLYVFFKKSIGRRVVDRAMLTIPAVGEIAQCLFIGRTCRLLGLLIKSGVPLFESLELVETSSKNIVYREMLAKLTTNVLNGNGLGTTLLETELVPPSAAEMILTAERTGSLGEASQLIGNHFEEDGEEKLRAFVAFLEPAVTIVMGVIVAIIVMAVAFPMFDLSNAVQN